MTGPGNIWYSMPAGIDEQVRRQKDLDRKLREQSAARSMEATQISSGGIVVTSGGSITLQAGAELAVDGGTLDITGGDLNVTGAITAGESISTTDTISGGALVSTGGLDVAVDGDVGGALTAGSVVSGDVDINGDLRAMSVYDTTLTVGSFRAVSVTNDDGQLGYVPSSLRFKQDVRLAGLDLNILDDLQVVTFRYKEAVARHGDEAPEELGGIAEQFHNAGMTYAVTYDEHGEPYGIEDRPLVYALLAKVQDLTARIDALEKIVEVNR